MLKSQAKFPLPKSEVIVKNLLGPHSAENLSHDIQEL